MRRPAAFELIAIAALWGVSLALPAIAARGSVYTGFELLLQGWRGFSYGVYSWSANPLFVAALAAAALARDRAAAALAALAVLVGATSFLAGGQLTESIGATEIQVEMRGGFYLWMLAILALCLRSLTRAVLPERFAGR